MRRRSEDGGNDVKKFKPLNPYEIGIVNTDTSKNKNVIISNNNNFGGVFTYETDTCNVKTGSTNKMDDVFNYSCQLQSVLPKPQNHLLGQTYAF